MVGAEAEAETTEVTIWVDEGPTVVVTSDSIAEETDAAMDEVTCA